MADRDETWLLKIEFSAPDMATAERLAKIMTQPLHEQRCAPWRVDGPRVIWDSTEWAHDRS